MPDKEMPERDSMSFEPMPSAGSGQDGQGSQDSGKPPVPKEVRISFWAWMVSAVMSFAAGVQIATDKEGFIREFVAVSANSTIPAGELRRLAEVGFTGMLVGIFGFGLLYVLFVFKMRAGRNWARIVLAALAVLGLLSQGVLTGTTDLLALVSVLISVVGLVMMFMPASNAYFNRFKRSP